VRSAKSLFINALFSRELCRRVLIIGALTPFLLWKPTRSAPAQQTSNPPEIRSHEAPPPFQIHVERNVVTVRVIVRDPEGRTVPNLTKDDFRLLDDGKTQEISGFSVETAPANAAPAPPAPATAQPGEAPAVPSALAPVPPEHFVGLFFDDLHLPVEAVKRTREAAWRFVNSQVGPQDRVAIFTASHQDDLDFTNNRAQLHDALFRIASRSHTLARLMGCPSIDEYEAYLIDQRQDPQAFEVAAGEAHHCDCDRNDDNSQACWDEARERTRSEAAQIWSGAELDAQNALQRIAAGINRLAAMAGRRTLVLVSPGFLTETRSADIEQLIQGALRQDVVISAIDAAGVAPFRAPPMEDPSRIDLQLQKDMIYKQGETQSRDVLANLAAGTGGFFFHNGNDFGEGFHETAAAAEVAYVLSFSPADFKLDGKFHALIVTLNGHRSWSVEARRGYFDPVQSLADQQAGQGQLDALMFSLDEIHALPVDVSALTGKRATAPATLTVVIHVDLSALQFRREADRSVNILTLDTALFDRDGKYLSGKEESFDMHLKDSTLRKLSKGGIYLKTSFQPPPGLYRIREVVHDAVEKQISALNTQAEIPGGKSHESDSSPEPRQGKPAEAGNAPLPRKSTPAAMADWTPEEFVKAIPELKGLRAATRQVDLAPLLARVGANVKAFFDTLPDVSAREEIVLERLDWSGSILEKELEQFNYLEIVKASATGNMLDEYRTDSKGRRTEPTPLEGGFVTVGFASMPDIFHPRYQPDSRFRYLGEQDVHGQALKVVYFGQIPGEARPEETIHTPLKTIDVLVQGVAWIDAESYQVARMRTDIAFPLDDPYLKSLTTESRFAKVHFRNDPRAVWLPAEVAVTINWYGQRFSNLHRYSGFRLFQVSSVEKVSSHRSE
jgi:VWFA-related protein